MTVILPSHIASVAGTAPAREPSPQPATATEYFEGVEFFKGDVWLSGRVVRGTFRRLSDVLNHATSGLLLHDAVVCGPAGMSSPGAGHDIWLDLRDIDLVGHTSQPGGAAREGEPTVHEHVAKQPSRLTVWTASHEIHGTVHLYPEADLNAFLRSDDPPLIVMTDADVSWVSADRTARQFPFVLLNRRRIFATRPG